MKVWHDKTEDCQECGIQWRGRAQYRISLIVDQPKPARRVLRIAICDETVVQPEFRHSGEPDQHCQGQKKPWYNKFSAIISFWIDHQWHYP
jgi:hypothetical protein